MYIPKKYGESQIKRCPWCNATAITKNEQNVPVCIKHKLSLFADVKCSCGKYVDVRDGKFGAFFICETCGIKSIKKILEVNQIEDITQKEEKNDKERKFEHMNNKDIKDKNEDMFDLMMTIKKDKRTQQQIAIQNKKELQKKEIIEEKIPTIYELFGD